MSSAARCFCHRRVDKLATVSAHKSIEGFDAVIAARVPIAIDDDETNAPDWDSGQCDRVVEPPFADLLRLGARLFLPAN
jgi:hypothetical protein